MSLPSTRRGLILMFCVIRSKSLWVKRDRSACFGGYWGIPSDESSWRPGDFGGWAPDLLQVWGAYQHIGIVDVVEGFSNADALADADGLPRAYHQLLPAPVRR